jgi:hypothetical protein
MNSVQIRLVDLTALWIERRDMIVPHTRKWAALDDPSFQPLPSRLKIYLKESHWSFWSGQYLYHFNTLAG